MVCLISHNFLVDWVQKDYSFNYCYLEVLHSVFINIQNLPWAGQIIWLIIIIEVQYLYCVVIFRPNLSNSSFNFQRLFSNFTLKLQLISSILFTLKPIRQLLPLAYHTIFEVFSFYSKVHWSLTISKISFLQPFITNS